MSRGANIKSQITASANRHRSPVGDATSASRLKSAQPTTMTPWLTFPMQHCSEITARAASARRGASGTCRITVTRSTQGKPVATATSAWAHTIRVLRRRVRRPFGSAQPACAARTRRLAALLTLNTPIRNAGVCISRAKVLPPGFAPSYTLRHHSRRRLHPQHRRRRRRRRRRGSTHSFLNRRGHCILRHRRLRRRRRHRARRHCRPPHRRCKASPSGALP